MQEFAEFAQKVYINGYEARSSVSWSSQLAS
jgi:hypothetical protein